MSIGFDQEQNIVNLGDSAEIFAYIYDPATDAPISEDDLVSVSFQIQRPDATTDIVEGSVEGDGKGFARYYDTDQVGSYIAVATFTLIDGAIRSVRSDFEVIDPFNPPEPGTEEVIGDLVWRKLEDCFDADDEGPWLRDMTMNYFSKAKMPEFIAEAIFDINQQNPPTNLTADYFVHAGDVTPDTPLVVLGTFLAVILHLMASYTEQPAPQGGQFAYEDRRDYVQRWETIYQIEMQRYMRWLALWKRQFLGLGHSKLLISNKAGRLINAPARTWMSGRGFR